jgi:hypothetical protein
MGMIEWPAVGRVPCVIGHDPITFLDKTLIIASNREHRGDLLN